MTEAELNKQREALSTTLHDLSETAKQHGGDLSQLQSGMLALQEGFKAQQQALDAYHRAQVEGKTGPARETEAYVVRNASEVNSGCYKSDAGVVRLTGGEVTRNFGNQQFRSWEWGILDDPQPKTEAQLNLQRAITRRNLVRRHLYADMNENRRFTPRLDREVVQAALACGGNVAKIFADSAGNGADWIRDTTLPELERELTFPAGSIGIFPRRQLPPGGAVQIPYVSNRLRVKKGAAATANNPAPASLSEISAQIGAAIEAGISAVATQVDRFASEDSLIPVEQEIARDIIETIRWAEDDTLFHGDTAANHQDAIASWDGRGMLGGTTGLGQADDHRRRWRGLRARAFDGYALDNNYFRTDQASAATPAGMRVALNKLGPVNLVNGYTSAGRIVAFVSWEYFFGRMLGADWSDFATMDKVGMVASLLTGRVGGGGALPYQVGLLHGYIPVCLGMPLTADLASTGLYTGSGSTTTMVVCDVDRFEYCTRQGAILESSVDIMANVTNHVTRMRSTFREKDILSATTRDVHVSINLPATAN